MTETEERRKEKEKRRKEGRGRASDHTRLIKFYRSTDWTKRLISPFVLQNAWRCPALCVVGGGWEVSVSY